MNRESRVCRGHRVSDRRRAWPPPADTPGRSGPGELDLTDRAPSCLPTRRAGYGSWPPPVGGIQANQAQPPIIATTCSSGPPSSRPLIARGSGDDLLGSTPVPEVCQPMKEDAIRRGPWSRRARPTGGEWPSPCARRTTGSTAHGRDRHPVDTVRPNDSRPRGARAHRARRRFHGQEPRGAKVTWGTGRPVREFSAWTTSSRRVLLLLSREGAARLADQRRERPGPDHRDLASQAAVGASRADRLRATR